MITFQQLYTRFADVVGISLTQNSQDMVNGKQDINQGLRLFRNAARRYTTRKEAKTNLVSNQQYYQMPPDFVRATTIRVQVNGLTFPVTAIDSEEMWNRINIIPTATVNVPTYYFVRGFNEIGLWPTPTSNVTNGLIVSYEPRQNDMVLDDVTSAINSYTATHPGTPVTASVTNGSAAVTLSQSITLQNMVGQWLQVTDGSGGNWYKIIAAPTGTTLTLENFYADSTNGSAVFIIGQCPDVPEDYQLGPMYYAAYNFFLKRKDTNQASSYKVLFEDLLNQFRTTYAAKTTGQVQNDIHDLGYNIFQIPPNPIT